MKLEKILLTPALAAKFLANAAPNRKMSQEVLAAYEYQMKNGKWRETGESIKISKDGKLLDGQYRCTAVVNTGISITVGVAWDVEEAAFWVVDSGKKRSMSDRLSAKGFSYAGDLATMLRWIWKYRNGKINNEGGTKIRALTDESLWSLHRGDATEIDEALAFILKNTSPHRLGCPLNPGLGAFTLYFARKNDRQKADEFFSGFYSGEGLFRTNVIYHLRERLQSGNKGIRKMQTKYKIALVIKAWNIYVSGGSWRQLKIRFEERVPEFTEKPKGR